MTYIWFYPEDRCGPTRTGRSSVTTVSSHTNWVTFEAFFVRHLILNRVRARLSGPVRSMLAFMFSGPPRTHDLSLTICPKLAGSLLTSLLTGLATVWLTAQEFAFNQGEAIAAGSMVCLFTAFWLYSACPICKISVHFLQAGEPFPFVERDNTLSGKEHIFAVRLLSWNSHSRYNPFWNGGAPQPLQQEPDKEGASQESPFSNKYFHSSLLGSQLDRKSRFETEALPDYWSLLYFALARQLRSDSGRRSGEVYRIGALLNRGSIALYILMLASVFLLTWFGFFCADGPPLHSQFPLAAGMAVMVWAAFAITAHRRKILGLTRWEAACKRRPFLNCPIFMALPAPHNGVVWEELRTASFDDPITTFGLDVEIVVKIVATAMVVIFLTLLQLIK